MLKNDTNMIAEKELNYETLSFAGADVHNIIVVHYKDKLANNIQAVTKSILSFMAKQVISELTTLQATRIKSAKSLFEHWS